MTLEDSGKASDTVNASSAECSGDTSLKRLYSSDASGEEERG